MAYIEDCTDVHIKQVIEFNESIPCYEAPINYHVYTKDKTDKQSVILFYGREMDTDYCERTYCKGSKRPFNLHLKHIREFADDDFSNNLFAILKKGYSCSTPCFGRPNMTCHYIIKNGSVFGSIYIPFTIYDNLVQIKSRQGIIIYTIIWDCCSCSNLCSTKLCFGHVNFKIIKGNYLDTNIQIKEEVGKITKLNVGIQMLNTDLDNFHITFPKKASAEHKILIINSCFMIDYMFFEKN